MYGRVTSKESGRALKEGEITNNIKQLAVGVGCRRDSCSGNIDNWEVVSS